MRSVYLLALSILLTTLTTAQMQMPDTRKFIEVTGSADMNISPNEIELQIQLREYDRSGKKVKLDDINNEFYRILKKHHVDTSALTFQDLNSYGWYWWHWWCHRHDYYQVRTVTLKLSPSTRLLKFVEDLNEKWVQNLYVSKSTHSKIHDYRKRIKMEAAKMAKEKATYLLESMGEELGNVLSVEEIPEQSNNHPYWWYPGSNLTNTLSNSTVSQASAEGPGNESSVGSVASIKLRYEVKVKFAIK